MVDKVSLNILSTQSLRQNFKSLSSGLKAPAKHIEDAAKVQADGSSANSKRMSDLVSYLNDAVSHSAAALDSLKRVQELSSPDDTEVAKLSDSARDLDKLRENMDSVLSMLKDQAKTAEVLNENFNASEAKIEDVDAATSRAEETGSSIKFGSEEAIDAHNNLNPSSVLALLED